MKILTKLEKSEINKAAYAITSNIAELAAVQMKLLKSLEKPMQVKLRLDWNNETKKIQISNIVDEDPFL